jgi:uncharacterized protein (TIGR02217 family)
MAYWLTTQKDQLQWSTITRFDPRFWTVNFPAPMMAGLTTQGTDGLIAHFAFQTKKDLAGIIWDSVDDHDHPLLKYETHRDYRGLTLRFRWRSFGDIVLLDAINGPVLTIEGHDSAGVLQSWFVRLWNYATGTPTDAEIVLDFSALQSGFVLPGADVWSGNIDRMFISVVPSGYDGTDTPLAAPIEARVEILELRVDGANAVLEIADAFVPEHTLNMANGYDDVYNLTPERVLRNILQLGYRGIIDHYVGMSHYPKLAWQVAAQKYLAVMSTLPVNQPCMAWHGDFFQRATQLGYKVQIALSFELLDSYCPDTWKQRRFDGAPALTGYTPPSTLISPASVAGIVYLQVVLSHFIGAMQGVNGDVLFQMGEPWWWSGLGQNRVPCFYDAEVMARYPAETGFAVPSPLQSVTDPLTPAHVPFLQWLATKLAQATFVLRDTAWQNGGLATILIYVPQILDAAAPMLAQANLPTLWAYPAYDRLQLEDYEFLQAGNQVAHVSGLATVRASLGYPDSKTDYFSGFVETAVQRAVWQRLVQALAEPGYTQKYIWAYPQVMRDGFTWFELPEEQDMAGIEAVYFPLALGLGAEGGPGFSTSVVQTQSGYEFRNVNWREARRSYDAAVGVRSEKDLATLLAFFEARRGRAYGFLYRDPLDFSSAPFDEAVSAQDQVIGTGDGTTTRFALVKNYGSVKRRIARPVAGSVRVSVNGLEQLIGWTLSDGGYVDFAAAPVAGAVIRAGFLFDVVVRFDQDQLSVSLATYRAGEIATVPLVEIREA